MKKKLKIHLLSMATVLAFTTFSQEAKACFQFDKKSQTITAYLYECYSQKIVNIPSQIDGVEVKGIGNSVFSRRDLTSVTIPNTITTIGENTFSNNKLVSINIPNSVTKISHSAFAYNELKSVVIPNSVKRLGRKVFFRNNLEAVTIPSSIGVIAHAVFKGNNLNSVTIPEGIEKIYSEAFSENPLISKIDIPKTVEYLHKEAFDKDVNIFGFYPNCFEYKEKSADFFSTKKIITITGYTCDEITDVIIPSTIQGHPVKTIGMASFRNMNITSVVVSEGVETIESSAFEWDDIFDDSLLTKVTLPSSISKIKYAAFLGNNLEPVIIKNSKADIDNNAFDESVEVIIK